MEAIGRQTLASLAFRRHVHRTKDPYRANTNVYADMVQLTGLSLIFKKTLRIFPSENEIDNAVKGALTNQSWQREAWIRAARLLDRSNLEDDLRSPRMNSGWQMQLYLDTLFTTCARGSTSCGFITIKATRRGRMSCRTPTRRRSTCREK